MLVSLLAALWLIPVTEVSALTSPYWWSQFEGFLGADDGTIDNCRFEKYPNPTYDWKIEKYTSYSRTSTYKHDNSYSLKVSNSYYRDVVVTQTIDAFNLQQIKDLSGGQVCFSFWFRADNGDNENARAIVVLDGVEYAGDWTPASDKTGDMAWTNVWVKATVPSTCQAMKVKIVATDPNSSITTVYLDDARLAIYDYKTKTTSKGELRLDLMYESCKDYWAQSGWNELQFSSVFSVEAADPANWRVWKAKIVMEMHPLVLVFPIPLTYAAQCNAELDVERKGFVGETIDGRNPIPVGSTFQDYVPFDLDVKAMAIALKQMTSHCFIALGKNPTVGGIVAGFLISELLSFYLNTYVYDDTSGTGSTSLPMSVWGDYFTKTMWDFDDDGPYDNFPVIAAFENRASFKWERDFQEVYQPEVRIYAWVDWIYVHFPGGVVTESIGPYFISVDV